MRFCATCVDNVFHSDIVLQKKENINKNLYCWIDDGRYVAEIVWLVY